MVIFPLSALSAQARTRNLRLEVTAGLGINGYFGNRHDKLAAPFSDVGGLRADLILQVPRQDQHVVRARFADFFRSQDRDPRAGGELALLVGVGVDGEVEKVGSDAAVVQQRVAFAGRAVADYFLATLLGVDQERQQFPLGRLDLLVEAAIALQRQKSVVDLPLAQLANAPGYRQRGIFTMTTVDAQRTAVRRQFLDVKKRDAVVRKDPFDRHERQVAEVLVVDGVELVVGYQPRQMRELHGDHAMRRQQELHATDKIVDVRHMGQHVVAEQQVGPTVFGGDLCGALTSEEPYD